MYCLIIPFLCSGSGSPHDSSADFDLKEDTVKLVGGPDGTAVTTTESHSQLRKHE